MLRVADANPLDAAQRRHTMRLKAMQFARIQQHGVARLLLVEAGPRADDGRAVAGRGFCGRRSIQN